MLLWKSRHVLCTTELYCQFLNPVVADCTCSTVLVFFGSQSKGKGKAVPVPCRHKGVGGLEVQLHTFFEMGVSGQLHALATLPPGVRASAAH
jgi:hypothetical protein